jgi:uncharacterized cupin superfamily protein
VDPADLNKDVEVDYALVLDGEIWALMDEGETLLRAGDSLVQRGTRLARGACLLFGE